MIIAITGASGVGKTTTLKVLAQQLPENSAIKIFHFDDMGMPNWDEIEDQQKWQEEATINWIDKLVKVVKEENVHILFEGSTNIKFYIQAFQKNDYSDYQIILFDCSSSIMEQRLIQRGQAELYTPQMLGWLNYLRREAKARDIEIIETDQLTMEEIGQKILNKLK